MNKEIRAIGVSLAAALAFFGLAFWGLRLSWLLSLILVALLYGGLLLLTKPRRRIGGIDVEEIPGGEELEEKLSQAREDFKRIGEAMEEIEDEELFADSRKLHQKAGNILKFLEENPEKITEARRFIDYYQETASSLLEKYVRLQESGLGSKDAVRLKSQTRQALLTLNRAFEGQFEKLMRNELMDMEADLRLLKQTMKMEGYEEESH